MYNSGHTKPRFGLEQAVNGTTFNTARALESAGVERDQAEAIASAIGAQSISRAGRPRATRDQDGAERPEIRDCGAAVGSWHQRRRHARDVRDRLCQVALSTDPSAPPFHRARRRPTSATLGASCAGSRSPRSSTSSAMSPSSTPSRRRACRRRKQGRLIQPPVPQIAVPQFRAASTTEVALFHGGYPPRHPRRPPAEPPSLADVATCTATWATGPDRAGRHRPCRRPHPQRVHRRAAPGLRSIPSAPAGPRRREP